MERVEFRGLHFMLVARATILMVEAFELGFSSCGFGGAELVLGLSRESRETKGPSYIIKG